MCISPSSLCTTILKDKIKLCKSIIHAPESEKLRVKTNQVLNCSLMGIIFLKYHLFIAISESASVSVRNSEHHGWNTSHLSRVTLHWDVRSRVRFSWNRVYTQCTQRLHGLPSAWAPYLVYGGESRPWKPGSDQRNRVHPNWNASLL